MAFFRKKYDPAMIREMYIDDMERKAKKEAEQKAKLEAKKLAALEAEKQVEIEAKKKQEKPETNTEKEQEPAVVEEKVVVKTEIVENNGVQQEQLDDSKTEHVEEIAKISGNKEIDEKKSSEDVVDEFEDGDDEYELEEEEHEDTIDEFEDEFVDEDVAEFDNDDVKEWQFFPEEKSEQQEIYEEINGYISNKYSDQSIKKVKITECDIQEKDDGKKYEKYSVTVSPDVKENAENSDDFHFIYEKITARKKEGKTVKKEKTTVTRKFTVVEGDKQIKDLATFEVKKDYELEK